jgi:hypothetical protein
MFLALPHQQPHLAVKGVELRKSDYYVDGNGSRIQTASETDTVR